MTTISIYLVDDSIPSETLSDVTVRIYNKDGSSFITQLTSDEDGVVTTDIPDGVYWVRFYKAGYSFASKLLLDVLSTANNVWVVTGNNLSTINPPVYSHICRCAGYLLSASGSASQSTILTFGLPINTRIVNNSIISTEKVIVQADSTGYASVDLIKGATYTLTMSSISDEVITIHVPTTSTCHITDLVYPRGVITSIVPASVSVVVNESTDTGVSVGSSSLVTLPDAVTGMSATDLVSFSYSSSAISAVVVDNNIYVTATEAGTHTIDVYSTYFAGDIGVSSELLSTLTVVAND